jgi:hypothetical protein
LGLYPYPINKWKGKTRKESKVRYHTLNLKLILPSLPPIKKELIVYLILDIKTISVSEKTKNPVTTAIRKIKTAKVCILIFFKFTALKINKRLIIIKMSRDSRDGSKNKLKVIRSK